MFSQKACKMSKVELFQRNVTYLYPIFNRLFLVQFSHKQAWVVVGYSYLFCQYALCRAVKDGINLLLVHFLIPLSSFINSWSFSLSVVFVESRVPFSDLIFFVHLKQLFESNDFHCVFLPVRLTYCLITSICSLSHSMLWPTTSFLLSSLELSHVTVPPTGTQTSSP